MNKTTHIQLLSPARNKETAKAAIQAGADAVYMGPPSFGARHAAGNSIEDIRETVSYAHRYGVEVLATINTLLKDEERAEASKTAWQLYEAGVDALIIQDTEWVKSAELPPIRLHASTQCDIRSIEKVRELQEMGFSRVVLARELSLKEIRDIHAAVPEIEIEAFVHGALCVSYSGRCYMSEVLLGRSANRGCCAQMCRMAYDLLDEDMNEVRDDNGQPIHQKYLLSLQDMDRSAYIADLIDAGVTTFKIEGRLKDADYVTNITAYYRQLIDKLRGNQTDTYTYNFIPNPQKTFHRGGTDYFLNGRSRPISNWETPKSTGEAIGQYIRSIDSRHIEVKTANGIELHNGDGLSIGAEGFAVNGVSQTDRETTIITTNTAVKASNGKITLYRNNDIKLKNNMQAQRRVWADIVFEITEDGFRLSIKPVNERLKSISREFKYAHDAASNPEKAYQTIESQLSKLGDSIYAAKEVVIHSTHENKDKGERTFPYFIPIKTLNEWRREVTTVH